MLTDSEDLVVDIFAGSNTTGAVAERLGRKWISIETRIEYVSASTLRFVDEGVSKNRVREIYAEVKHGGGFDQKFTRTPIHCLIPWAQVDTGSNSNGVSTCAVESNSAIRVVR